VAAFLDQRAAGVGAKAVPVADLGVKRLAVLADADLVNLPHGAGMGHANHLGHRRHVAVFLRHPGQRLATPRLLHQCVGVCHFGAQGLLGQNVQIGAQRLLQHVHMGEVGCRHHHRIAQAALQQPCALSNCGTGVFSSACACARLSGNVSAMAVTSVACKA
jgi:hypothetical protein